ncbi:MAG: alpha/beta hydrolase [Lactobacillaceae bacterium]|jgi:pimeloyl-ACP methyl ester carboxylesterase|nr:alpha/beta hydrolase [Lactobacillaceae bacterium]
MSKISTSLGEINYNYRKSINSQPTIIFIPGFGGDSTYFNFKTIIDKLPGTYGFMAIDTIGTGESISATMERSSNNILKNIMDVVNYEQIENKITVVGHSLGGSYAMILANNYPTKINSLLLIEPSYSEIREAILSEGGEFQSPELIESAKKAGNIKIADFLKVVNPNNDETEKQKNAEIFFNAYGNPMIYQENNLIENLLDDLKNVEENLSKSRLKISVVTSKGRRDEYLHSKFRLYAKVFSIGDGHYLHWSHPDFIVKKIIELQ